MAGISGTVWGARGETLVDMLDLQELRCLAGGGSSLAPESRASSPRRAEISRRKLLLRGRCRCTGWCTRCGGGRRGRRTVEALDFGGLAQMRDELGLRLARDISRDLILDLVE